MSYTTSATCAFPGCDQPTAPPPATGGRSRYCDDPEHNATTAFRARRARGGVTTSEAETEQPVTMARVTGAELLRQMRELASTMTTTAERLTTAVATIGDTTAAEPKSSQPGLPPSAGPLPQRTSGRRPSAGPLLLTRCERTQTRPPSR